MWDGTFGQRKTVRMVNMLLSVCLSKLFVHDIVVSLNNWNSAPLE